VDSRAHRQADTAEQLVLVRVLVGDHRPWVGRGGKHRCGERRFAACSCRLIVRTISGRGELASHTLSADITCWVGPIPLPRWRGRQSAICSYWACVISIRAFSPSFSAAVLRAH
jgi:hypothetical protein